MPEEEADKYIECIARTKIGGTPVYVCKGKNFHGAKAGYLYSKLTRVMFRLIFILGMEELPIFINKEGTEGRMLFQCY
jgi:hypothetical protein